LINPAAKNHDLPQIRRKNGIYPLKDLLTMENNYHLVTNDTI